MIKDNLKSEARIIGRIDIINLIRVIACIMVFSLHSTIFAQPGWEKGSPFTFLFYTPAWAGVWIFFIISGYLMGKSFYSGKYNLTKASIIRFYLSRLIRIIPLYYFSIFIIIIFNDPTILRVENIKYLIPLLTFTYNGALPINPIGAAWYISTLMQLYLITPIIYKIFKNIKVSKKIIIAIIIGGLVVRILPTKLLSYNHISEIWHKFIYVPFYMNLDLFIVGFLINKYRIKNKGIDINKYTKAFIAILIIFICFNSYIYFKAVSTVSQSLLSVYQLVFPSIYLIIMIPLLLLNNLAIEQHNNADLLNNKVNNIISYCAKISFGFYLWHSTVLKQMQLIIVDSDPFIGFLKLQISSFVITIILSIITYYTIEKASTKYLYSISKI